MSRQLIRIGSPSLKNESKLNTADGFDILFNGYHEFVYMPDGNDEWIRVNGTWISGMRYLMNDTQID